MDDDYVFQIKTKCTRSDGRIVFKDKLKYGNMDKANVELLEGKLVDLLKELNEYSKARTAEKAASKNK